MRTSPYIFVLIAAMNCISATVEGTVDPKQLLAWVDSQKNVAGNLAVRANGKDMNHGGTGFCKQCSDANSRPTAQAKTISLYQNAQAVFFDADMDIDCDGSNNGICGGTDPSHQNQLSCDGLGKCSMDNGGPIDAAGTPFYVIPVDTPFRYSTRGIALGQIAAIINRTTTPASITYGPFLDEDGVSQEIGEASAAMAALLGVPNNPNTGGQDTGLVYIIFRGTSARLATIADMANHQKAITLGQSLAASLLTTGIAGGSVGPSNAPSEFRISGKSIFVGSSARHWLSVYRMSGECVLERSGEGPGSYSVSGLRPGVYMLRIDTRESTFCAKLVRE